MRLDHLLSMEISGIHTLGETGSIERDAFVSRSSIMNLSTLVVSFENWTKPPLMVDKPSNEPSK